MHKSATSHWWWIWMWIPNLIFCIDNEALLVPCGYKDLIAQMFWRGWMWATETRSTKVEREKLKLGRGFGYGWAIAQPHCPSHSLHVRERKKKTLKKWKAIIDKKNMKKTRCTTSTSGKQGGKQGGSSSLLNYKSGLRGKNSKTRN